MTAPSLREIRKQYLDVLAALAVERSFQVKISDDTTVENKEGWGGG